MSYMEKIKRLPTTVYLDRNLSRAAKVKAALSDKSFSDVVNESLAKWLSRDEADLALIRSRKKGRGRDYEDFLRDLKRDGLI